MSEGSKRRLKLWIRMLAATRSTEGALRDYLRRDHATTLPRFDVMAALYRRPGGVTMSELSRMLLVSNGNITAVVDRLEGDDLARREASKTDRRSIRVALTPAGRQGFEALAAGHEAELARAFAGLSDADVDAMTEILKKLGKT